jgi:hypothetical protein
MARFYPQPGRVLRSSTGRWTPSTGTFKAAALFGNPDNLLRPGQYGRVQRHDVGPDQGALLVPQRAVTELQGKYLIAVVSARTTRPTSVRSASVSGSGPTGSSAQGLQARRAGDRRRHTEGAAGNDRQSETLCPGRTGGARRNASPAKADGQAGGACARRQGVRRPCPSSSSTGRSWPWSSRS